MSPTTSCVAGILTSLLYLVGPPVQELEKSWAALANSDAMAAFKSMSEMIATPKEAVAFLGTKLQPAPAVDAVLIEKLVADLDSQNFAARQKATKELENLQGRARPALEKMLAKPPSAESHSRAKKLLEQLDGPVSSPEELRVIRAVEVLERIGTAEARELLSRLAKGAPGARLTDEAKDSLGRLKK